MSQFHKIPRSRKGFLSLALRLVLAMAVLASFTADVGMAQGLKDKLQGAFGKKKNKDPKIQYSDIETSEGKSEPVTGMREALLVSVPTHAASLPMHSTIAFIEFNHIEHRIEAPVTISEVINRQMDAAYPDGKEIRSEIRSEAYNLEVCAAQVEAALVQHLADLNRFKVVTRDHIGTVLDEQQFANSGSVDTKTAAKLGELIGADVLVYGQVQLCVSSRQDFEALANMAHMAGSEAVGKKAGFIGNLMNAAKEFKPDKLRSLILAQIQLIEADTGKQIFTTSMTGVFSTVQSALAFDMSHRELISLAADDLANVFIDNFLGRQEARYVGLYADSGWEFDKAIDLIQLGDCPSAEAHLQDVYARHRHRMSNQDYARLMYNHGISLACSNRPEEALDRLWASLRLSNSPATFAAIEFTNDLVDRGRRIQQEEDDIIRSVRAAVGPVSRPAIPAEPQIDAEPAGAKGGDFR